MPDYYGADLDNDDDSFVNTYIDKPHYNEATWDDKKKDAVLRALGVAGYTTESGEKLFGGVYQNLLQRAKKHGLSEEDIPEYSSWNDVIANLGALSSRTKKKRSHALQQVITMMELEQSQKQEELRDESIKMAQDALQNFIDDKSYEPLLETIRNLPATLSDEDVERLKRNAAHQARQDEVQRLKKIGASTGLRGLGGGAAIASLAEEQAANTAGIISYAFNQIEMEKAATRRRDLIEQTFREAQVLTHRENTLLQLQQNLRAANAGIPMGNLSTGPQGMAEWIAMQQALAQEASLSREQYRRATESSMYSALGTILGATIQSTPAIVGLAAGSFGSAGVS